MAAVAKPGRGRQSGNPPAGEPPRINLPDLIRFLDGGAIEGLAEESGVTAREVVASLPKPARRFVPAGKFMAAMDDIAGWGEVSLVLRTADGVIEFISPLPKGDMAHGYFRLLGDAKIRAHLRYENCAAIAFVERPFMGRPSAAVLFFDRDGDVMFKICPARDENGAPRDDQLKLFRALAARLTPVIGGKTRRPRRKK